MLAMFDYEATPVLASISIPVLIIAADKDILTKPEASAFMARSIPGAKLIVLTPSGHMGPLERNDQMIDAIKRFGDKVFVPVPLM